MTEKHRNTCSVCKAQDELMGAIVLSVLVLIPVLTVLFDVLFVPWLFSMADAFRNMDDWENDPEIGSPIPFLIVTNTPVVVGWIVLVVRTAKRKGRGQHKCGAVPPGRKYSN